MRVRVLGDVAVDDRPVTSRRVRALLCRLAVTPGEIVAEDALIEAIWGKEPPVSARTALHTHIGALRDLLEPGRARRSDGAYLFRRHGGYLLDLGDELDVTLVRHDVDRAESVRTDRPEVARALVRDALALWSRPAFAEFHDEHWALAAATTAEEYATRAVTLWAELCLDGDDPGEAIPSLAAALDDMPYDEQLAALLMRALHRCGRKADALELYQSMRHRLVEDLGVEPGPALRETERVILEDLPPAPRGPRTVDDGPTTFVGRVGAEAELRRRLGTHRFVTVVGPGGVGKTRLARRVAAAVAADWHRDLITVDLATLGPDAVATALVEAFGGVVHPKVDPDQLLRASAGRRECVVLLDTCEHRVDRVRLVVDQLLDVPGVVILATSRSPVGHRAEFCFELEPLSTADAVVLLLDRAGLDPDDDADRQALSEICRLLDGLPLAIELAAGRLRTLSPSQLSALLRRGEARLRGSDDRPLRHRTLAETIEWSYRLLDDDARTALRRLAALHGPFTHEMASSFLDGIGDPTGALLDLVDRSLVSTTGPSSFRLLDTVREFARNEAARMGELERLLDDHAAWVSGLVLGRLTGQPGPTPTDLGAEIVPALDHLHTARPADELVLAASLGTWWVESSRLAEGRARLEKALAASPEAPELYRHVARLLAGLLAWYHGDGHDAIDLLRGAIPGLAGLVDDVTLGCARAGLAFAERRLDDAEHLAAELLERADLDGHVLGPLVLFSAANIALYRDDTTSAIGRYRLLETDAGRRGDRATAARAHRFLALATTLDGSPDEGWALAEAGVGSAVEIGDLSGLAQAHAIAALAATEAGDPERARVHAEASLSAVVGNHDSFTLRLVLPVAACLALEEGRHQLAVALLGWLRHFVDHRGLFLLPAVETLTGELSSRLDAELTPLTVRRGTARAAAVPLHDLATLVRQR